MITVKDSIAALKRRLINEFEESRWNENHHLLVRRKRDIIYELEKAVVDDTTIHERQWQFFERDLLTSLAESIRNNVMNESRVVAEAANYLHGCHR